MSAMVTVRPWVVWRGRSRSGKSSACERTPRRDEHGAESEANRRPRERPRELVGCDEHRGADWPTSDLSRPLGAVEAAEETADTADGHGEQQPRSADVQHVARRASARAPTRKRRWRRARNPGWSTNPRTSLFRVRSGAQRGNTDWRQPARPRWRATRSAARVSMPDRCDGRARPAWSARRRRRRPRGAGPRHQTRPGRGLGAMRSKYAVR